MLTWVDNVNRTETFIIIDLLAIREVVITSPSLRAWRITDVGISVQNLDYTIIYFVTQISHRMSLFFLQNSHKNGNGIKVHVNTSTYPRIVLWGKNSTRTDLQGRAQTDGLPVLWKLFNNICVKWWHQRVILLTIDIGLYVFQIIIFITTKQM